MHGLRARSLSGPGACAAGWAQHGGRRAQRGGRRAQHGGRRAQHGGRRAQHGGRRAQHGGAPTIIGVVFQVRCHSARAGAVLKD